MYNYRPNFLVYRLAFLYLICQKNSHDWNLITSLISLAVSRSLQSHLWGWHLVLGHRRFLLHISTEHRTKYTKHTKEDATTPTEQKNTHQKRYLHVKTLSVITVATRHGVGGPGIESGCGRDFFPPVQTGPGAHTTSYGKGTGSFLGVIRPGREVDHPPLLAPRLKNSRFILLLPLWAFVASYRVSFTLTFTY
jgi:hypothetical protein